jgi:probable rRNA maturation factor
LTESLGNIDPTSFFKTHIPYFDMALPTLNLSLQFGDIPHAVRHRAALPRHQVARWIRHSLAQDGEITVRIVGAEEGQRLNREFRKKDYATNVLTFDYMASPLVMADLVLCAPVVAKEAREQGKTLQAHYAHLLVHGTLHAQGWDHETSKADAEAMEGHEIEIMRVLGFKNPY